MGVGSVLLSFETFTEMKRGIKEMLGSSAAMAVFFYAGKNAGKRVIGSPPR
jgi:hypothetical protein